MAAVGISRVVFQPGVSVKCAPWPRAEDESQVHVPFARQDARHACPGLMAGIPLHLPLCRRHPRPRCPAGSTPQPQENPGG